MLFCNLCIQAKENKHNKWANPEKGNKYLKKDKCETHAKSAAHMRAVKFEETKKKNLNIEQFAAKKIIDNDATTSIFTEYRNLFFNIYWACKEELPIMKICSLHALTKNSLNVLIPSYHLSQKSSTNIIESIGTLMKDRLIEELKETNHIGILLDESTDVSNKSILLLYFRYYSQKQTTTNECFLKLFELEHGNAQYIYQKVKEYLLEIKIFNKIKFLCTDGAPTMASTKDGLAGKLKKDIKLLNSFKCIAHQQNLALKHTYKEFDQLTRFNRKLVSIISYFQTSPKRVRILENSELELDYDRIFKLIRAKEIRLNSFFYATTRVRYFN